MFDFVKWRGDLPLTVSPFCEVDALIFSQLSYLHFRDALVGKTMRLCDAATRIEALPREPGNAQIMEARHTLLTMAAESVRYGDIPVMFCEDRFDATREMQFAAVTFALPDGTYVVAYRGTDATLVGWREDFNMSFSCPVSSQTEAARYLYEVAVNTTGALRLCGHSKGGNLAMYASASCDASVLARIKDAYLFDAPGLDQATVTSKGYFAAQPIVRCYVPQTSIIGRLMGVPEHYTVVHSTANSMAQHNVFTWALDGPRLKTLPALDNASRLIQSTIDDFLLDSTPEMRRTLVEALFNTLGASNAHTLGDMAERWTDTVSALWSGMRTLDPATRKTVQTVVMTLASSGVDTAIRFLNPEKDLPSKP